MTKICVIGGGPAGMYTSKYLLNSNYKVTMYEKNKPFSFFKKVISPFTSYTFNHFNDIILNKNFEMILGKKVNVKDIEHRYDAFVIATGASKAKKLEIKGYEHCTQALDIAKNYKNDKVAYRGDVLIVGCGNVAMDILRYLFSKPKVNSITVLARKGPFAAAFSNAESRNVYDIKDIAISNNVDIGLEYKKLNIKEGKDARRKKIFNIENIQKNQLALAGEMKTSNSKVEPSCKNDKQNAIVGSQSCNDKQKLVVTKEDEKVEGNKQLLQKESQRRIEAKEKNRRTLNMSFYSEIEQIIRERQKYTVDIAEKGKLQKTNFDMVISAIGFEKPKKILSISKPVFYVGWCKNPMGSLIDIKKDAFSVAQQITKFFAAKCTA